MGIFDTASSFKRKVQAKAHHIHKVHHVADLAYLSTAFIENQVLHHLAVGTLITVVATALLIGEGEA
jgi:hypothetical protein